MPEDQADLLERNAMAQHLGRRRVPQDVRPFDRRHDAGPLHEALHHRRDAVAIPERPAWRDRAQEHAIALTGGRPALEIGGDRIPDVLRQRQADLVARLARDPQRARLPLDVDETELRHVAGPQPEARQEQDDRAVTPARNGVAITGSDQPVHLLRRQIPRHVGKPPMGVGRNDVVETCLAAAFDGEVPQERSQAGRQLLDGSTPALARAVHEVAANNGRPPASRVRSKRRHHAGGIASVELDGGIGRPAMLAQPRFEVGDQLRLGGLHCHGRGPANADLDEVPAKEPGAENGVVVATSSPGARTSTGAQVLAERRQIDVGQACAMLGHDMADMSCRPQIAHCRRGAIALPFERCCEAVEVRPAWPAPQMPQHLRCREVGLQHVRPRL